MARKLCTHFDLLSTINPLQSTSAPMTCLQTKCISVNKNRHAHNLIFSCWWKQTWQSEHRVNLLQFAPDAILEWSLVVFYLCVIRCKWWTCFLHLVLMKVTRYFTRNKGQGDNYWFRQHQRSIISVQPVYSLEPSHPQKGTSHNAVFKLPMLGVQPTIETRTKKKIVKYKLLPAS